MDALFGHTGFVGSVLARSHQFEGFNSETIKASAGRKFDVAVCAAAPGSMAVANRNPEADARRIRSLMEDLRKIEAGRFVLISTIAAMQGFGSGEDEASAKPEEEIPYGSNRRELEEFCSGHFENCLVLRLPALFGPGLKKNFLFDIMNPAPGMLTDEAREDIEVALGADARRGLSFYRKNGESGFWILDRKAFRDSPETSLFEDGLEEAGLSAIRFTNPNSAFQFYGIESLWLDAQLAMKEGLGCVNLATQPIPAGELFEEITGRKMPESGAPVHRENMKTRWAGVWGMEGCHVRNRASVMRGILDFVKDGGAA